MFKLTFVVLVSMCALATQAAVIRATDKDSDVLETTTASTGDESTTLEPEFTTVKDDDLTRTPTEITAALSRDEEATILIADQTLFDSAPAELIQTEVESVEVEKSGKLLLLSTPKIAEKQKQPEDNLEESEEENETVENVTQISRETTTVDSMNDETTTMSNVEDEQTTKNQMDTRDELRSEDMAQSESGDAKADEQKSPEASMVDLSTAEKITKLYPINDTLYADNSKMMDGETKEGSGTVLDDLPKETLNSNLGSVILEEPEADYVLVESEVLEGSYTDVDSELHLQPIVQSVEIVPSSLDDTLLINYVQSW